MFANAKLVEHGIECSNFEFIPGVAHNRLTISIIECLVTAFATFFVHPDIQVLYLTKRAHPADEFFTGHGLIMRSLPSAVKCL